MSTLDEQDQAILAQCQADLDAVPGLRIGDWVEFPDNVTRRIAYLWPDEVQTTDAASFYLGRGGYVSMSGSLYRSVPISSLVRTDRTKDGRVWFFHHGYVTAGGGIDATIPFRVYTCPLVAPLR